MSINVLKLQGSITDSRFPTMGKFIDPTPVMPVTSGLVGLYVLNSRADWLKNFANPSLPATLGGNLAPDRTSQYAALNQNGYLDLGFTVGADWTGMVITRVSDEDTGGQAVSLSNYGIDANYGASTGDSLVHNPPGAQLARMRTYFANKNSTTNTVGVQSVDTLKTVGLTGAEIIGMVGTVNSGNAIYRQNSDGAVIKLPVGSFVAPNGRNTEPNPRTLRAGMIAGTSTAYTGKTKCSLIAVWSRSLTDTELRQCSDYLANVWCKDMGIALHGA